MITLDPTLYETLDDLGFERVKFMSFQWTRHRWWMFWHAPNGGDILTIEPNLWYYSPVPGGSETEQHGYTDESLNEFLRTL